MPVLVRAKAVFAETADADAARDRFHDVQRSEQPVSAFLLPRNATIEPRQLAIGNHWWMLGLSVNRNGWLETNSQMIGDFIKVRDYLEAAPRTRFELEVWLDAKECQARGLTTLTAAPAQPAPVIIPRHGHTVEEYRRVRAWLLGSPLLHERRGEAWRGSVVGAAREAPEVKDIRISVALLRDAVRQYPELQARSVKDRVASGTSQGCVGSTQGRA